MGAGTRGEKLENERKKEAQHKLGGFKGEGEEGAVDKLRESVPHPRQATRQGSSSVGREWAGKGPEEKIWRRKSAQSARTTAKEAGTGNAVGRASTSTTAGEAGASNAAGRASASTTTKIAGANSAAARASASTTGEETCASRAAARASASTTAK
jgi:hypothetical protein